MVRSAVRGGPFLESADWLLEPVRVLALFDFGVGDTGGVGRFGTKKHHNQLVTLRHLNIK